MKKLNDEQTNELERLYNWSLTIVQYMDCFSPEGSFMMSRFEATIRDVYAKQELRGMRALMNDVRQWAKGLPVSQIEELNQLLKAKFGADLNSDAITRRINTIIQRGVIKNMSEYKLLFDYIDEIDVDDSRREEVEKVNSLLEEWQKKTGKV